MTTYGLKVLMISGDRNIAVIDSAVSKRMQEYGALVEELHIIILSDSSHRLKAGKLGKNVFFYPTSSTFKFLRPFNAAKLGKRIVLEKGFVRGQSLVTTQDPFECGLAGLKVKKRWRIPLEVQLHTDPESAYFTGFLNNLRKRISRKVLAQADSVRVVSEFLRSKLGSYKLKAPISVLPIYVDQEKIKNIHVEFDLHALFGWATVLLSVARLTSEKNLSLALEVLAQVRKTYPDTGLVIVGAGPEENSLRLKAKSLKLSGFVEFVGWRQELGSYYATADLYLQTSVFEGYGLSLVEAGLSGLPVVTTKVGLAEVLTHGKEAYIYPVGEVGQMVSGVADLIEHKTKRENLSFNFRRFLEDKLLSRENYLDQIKIAWEETAKKI